MKIAVFCISILMPLASRAQSVLSVHGSGTTNPSQCYWTVMEELTARAKLPIRFSYRAVGSSTGQKEFIEDLAIHDFASGDIPLTAERYQTMQDNNQDLLHLPVFVGAVAVFTSHDEPIRLEACTLARIYMGDITDWSDPDIRDLNPDIPAGPIQVGRRVRGSSSTTAFTEYLHAECPEEFPQELVKSKPVWPNLDNALACQGSAGMVDCIQSADPGMALGYLDAGHGNKAGLQAVELLVDDEWLTVTTDLIAAAERNVLPDSLADDFSAVSLVNRPNSWPMVSMTYLYVRQDLSFMGSPEQRGLLIAFLRAMQDDDYIQVCVQEYGFLLPSAEIRKVVKEAIDDLETSNTNITQWTFESDTDPIDGQGDYVLSRKRRSVAALELARTREAVEELEVTVADLQDTVSDLQDAVRQLQSPSFTESEAAVNDNEFTDENVQQLTASLVMSSLAFTFWVLAGMFYVYRFFTKP